MQRLKPLRLAGALILCCASCIFTPTSHLMRAEVLRRDKKYSEAIEQYRLYIEQRLAEKHVPEEQNPFFYYLLIGDSYLGLSDPASAKESYLIARDNKAEPDLVAAKLRSLALYYEDRKQYQDAIDVLQEFRELDPLLFDLDIDRNHKKMLEPESSPERTF